MHCSESDCLKAVITIQRYRNQRCSHGKGYAALKGAVENTHEIAKYVDAAMQQSKLESSDAANSAHTAAKRQAIAL